MPPARGADNIGTLSVDILADLTKFDDALSLVEQKLGKANKDVHIRIGITDAQLARLQKAAELAERIQKTKVDIGGLAGAAAPRGGGPTAAPGGKANVNVAFKEADLAKAFRAAAVAAFAQPIPGVKLDLDLEYLSGQLSGLGVSFSGNRNVTQSAGGAGTPAARSIPAGIREEIRSDKIRGAIDDMFTAFNVALKRSGGRQLAGGSAEAKFTAIADAFGDELKKVVQLGQAEGPYGRPVTGGAVGKMLEGAADDVADKLEEAGRTFYERIQKTGLFAAYRAAGGQPAATQPAGGTQGVPASISQEKAAQLAQMRAAEAQAEVARRQASAPMRTPVVPRSIDDINNFARQIAAGSGYDVSRATGNKTRPWQDLQREFVGSRKSKYGAFGRIATSQGTDITDLLMAAGPGARALSGFGEVMQQGKPSGQYVSLSPEEQEFLRGEIKQQGQAAGHDLVRQMAPREMLRRLLMANRGVGGQEAKEITQWAMREGGPLASRDRGAQLSSATGGMRSLSSLMSMGGGVYAHDERIIRLQEERQAQLYALAQTGVPAEQRRLRAQIANRSGQLRRLGYSPTQHAANLVMGEQNRQMIEEGAIDPLSRERTVIGDRPSIVAALANMSQFRGDQEAYAQQVGDIRQQLLGGFLPQEGEASKVGAMTGMWTQGHALFGEIRNMVNQFRASVGLEETKGRSVKSMVGQLEREGFPVEAAGISSLFGEAATRRAFAEQALASYPQRTGMTEARLTGVPTERRGTVAPGETIPGGMTRGGRWAGDIGVRSFTRQTELDAAQRRYSQMFGRNANVQHDPLAAGLTGGRGSRAPLQGPTMTGELLDTAVSGSRTWEQLGVMGEKGPKGAHPLRQSAIGGELKKIRTRIENEVGRELGMQFDMGKLIGTEVGSEGYPGAETLGRFKTTVEERMGADPRVQEMLAEQAPLERRIRALRRLARFQARGQDQGYYRSGAPDVLSGDEMRMRYYEQSGMAPQGGIPLSGEQIRKLGKSKRGFGPFGSMPAIGLPGAASQMGPTIVPPGEPPGGGGTTTGGGPMGAGVVHVWIDGPFPLRVSMPGGAARAAGKTQAGAADAEPGDQGVAGAPRGRGRGKGAGTKGAAGGKAQAPPRFYTGASEQQVINSLISAGVDPSAIESILANTTVPEQLITRQPAPEALAARAAIREAQARLPSRALSTTMVQLSQRVFGGRGGPEERMIELGAEQGRLAPLITRRERLAATVREAQGERDRYQQLAALGKVTPHLTVALKDSERAVKDSEKAYADNEEQIGSVTGRIKELETGLVTTKDVFRNLGAGFIGGIAGGLVTQGVGVAIQVVEQVGAMVKQALDPAIEVAADYVNTTQRVIGSLSDQVRANQGHTQATVALAAAQAGLADSTYIAIAPELEQAATIEAGNRAFKDYNDLLRAGTRLGQQGIPRGLVQSTGGFMDTGLLGGTVFGEPATPSSLENFLKRFEGAGAIGPRTGSLLTGNVGYSTDFITDITTRFKRSLDIISGYDALKMQRDQMTDEEYRRRAKELSDAYMGTDIAIAEVERYNAQLAKVNSQFTVGLDATAEAGAALDQTLQALGVDQGKRDRIRDLGIVFRNLTGQIVTDEQSLTQALVDLDKSFTQMTPETWLRSITGSRGPGLPSVSSGTLSVQIYGLEQQSRLARQAALGQFALQRFAAPPVRLDQVLSGMTGVPSQFMGPGPGSAVPRLGDMFQAMGIASIERSIGAIGNPAAQQEARQMLGFVQQAGAEMHSLQVQAQRIQMASAFRQMNRDLFVTNRQLEDVVGLTGRTSVQVEGGALVQASEIGVLERRNMLLGRSLQLLQFEHQQRSLNYQVALAGFMAEGATGEERAARLEVAEREAQFQQTMLTGQQTLADNSWQIQQLQNTRAFEDAMYQSNELVRRLDDTAALQRIDDKVAQWAEIRDGALGVMDTYIQQGNGMIQLAIGVGQQMIQLGADVAEAERLATQGLIDAYNSLHGILSNPALNPELIPYIGQQEAADNRPGMQIGDDAWRQFREGERAGPHLLMGGPGTVTPFAYSGGGVQVQIVNPSAGVDTQALTRVVISELNRQASLRGLNNVM